MVRGCGSITRTRRAEWLTRAGLILFGFALAVVLLETGLHIASYGLQAVSSRPIPESWTSGRIRVLCLGDSNTFGLYVKPEASYPHQLEVLWNKAAQSRRLEVVNLGYPGTNSTRLLRDLDRTISTLVPDVIILMIGVNDFWTERFPEEGDEKRVFWRRHSRLYRLYLLIFRGSTGEVEYVRDPDRDLSGAQDRLRVDREEFDVSFRKRHSSVNRKVVEGDLLRLIDRIKDWGIDLHLMTYPARTQLYALANPIIRSAALRSGTPLIDLEATFEPLCPDAHCPDLLFPDNHPTRAGYRVVAETILSHLSVY